MRKPRIGNGIRREAPVQFRATEGERTAMHVQAGKLAVLFGLDEHEASLSTYMRALVNADAAGLVDWSKLPPMRALTPRDPDRCATGPQAGSLHVWSDGACFRCGAPEPAKRAKRGSR